MSIGRFIFFSTLVVLLSGCAQKSGEEKHTIRAEKNKEKQKYQRFLKSVGLSVDSGVVVLIPPSSCACNTKWRDSLPSVEHAIVLYNKNGSCPVSIPTQECVAYDPRELNKTGGRKMYALIFSVKNDSIIEISNWIDE